MLATLPITDLDVGIIQPRFETALRQRVGQGKLSRAQLAHDVGVGFRTIDGWLNDKRLPPTVIYFRLRQFFGLDFELDIFNDIDWNIGVIGREDRDRMLAVLENGAPPLSKLEGKRA